MVGVDLAGRDLWPSIGNVAGSAGIGGASSVLSSAVGGDWLGMGLKLLGIGGTSTSAAGSTGITAFNTSGWAVGEGSEAQGAGIDSSASAVAQWPWWVWVGGATALILIIRKGK